MWEKVKQFFGQLFDSIGGFFKKLFGADTSPPQETPSAPPEQKAATRPRKSTVITEESIRFLPEPQYRRVAELLYDEKRPDYVYSDSKKPGVLVKDRPKEEKKKEPKKPTRVIQESAWPFDMWRARKTTQFPGSWRARRTGFKTASGTFYVSQADEQIPQDRLSPESIDAKIKELGIDPTKKSSYPEDKSLLASNIETPTGIPNLNANPDGRGSKA